jgi:hypothetical protein
VKGRKGVGREVAPMQARDIFTLLLLMEGVIGSNGFKDNGPTRLRMGRRMRSSSVLIGLEVLYV